MNELSKSEELFNEALTIRKNLIFGDGNQYLPEIAASLNNIANLNIAKNEYNEAFGKYEEALKIYRKITLANPEKFLPDVATTLNNLANLHSFIETLPKKIQELIFQMWQ